MIHWFTRNLGWKLVSLLAAVVIWILVANEPELATFVSVPVEYKDIPDDMEISSEVLPSIYLELRGPSGELRSFAASNVPVILNMSGVHRPGERTFTVGQSDVKLPRGIRLVRAIPAQLRFRFEHRVTRSIPVHARFSSSPQKGYEVAHYEVFPPSLTVVGPESRVARITFASTDLIDLSPVIGTSEFRVETYVDDPQVRFQSPPQVVVRVQMKKQ